MREILDESLRKAQVRLGQCRRRRFGVLEIFPNAVERHQQNINHVGIVRARLLDCCEPLAKAAIARRPGRDLGNRLHEGTHPGVEFMERVRRGGFIHRTVRKLAELTADVAKVVPDLPEALVEDLTDPPESLVSNLLHERRPIGIESRFETAESS